MALTWRSFPFVHTVLAVVLWWVTWAPSEHSMWMLMMLASHTQMFCFEIPFKPWGCSEETMAWWWCWIAHRGPKFRWGKCWEGSIELYDPRVWVIREQLYTFIQPVLARFPSMGTVKKKKNCLLKTTVTLWVIILTKMVPSICMVLLRFLRPF